MAEPSIRRRSASAASIWPRMAAQRVDARIERRIGAARRIGRQRAGHQRRAEQRLRLEQRRPAHRRSRTACRSAAQGLPWRRAPAATGRPRPAPARPARAAPSTKNAPTPISVADMWASGARSPEAPTEPWHGTTGVRPLASSASSRRTVSQPHARRALGEAGELERHHQPRDGDRHRRADAGGMRQHDVALQRLEVGGLDAHAGQLAEAGVDAVDRLAPGEDGRDRPGRRARSRRRLAGSRATDAPR